MLAEEVIEVGAVDVDFATYLGEGDEALVAVVLPRLGGDAEEKARLLSMFEQSEAVNKAVFIKNFLSQKPFKVFVVDENTRIFINQLSSLNALYRTYGVSYDTLVKTLRENFSEKKCNAAIERLREATMRLVSVCLDIRDLVKQFNYRWQQTMQDK